MIAILNATGENDRLQPLTNHLPTPMLPVANRPAMEYAVDVLAQAGVKRIVVCLYRLGGCIESHFGNGRRWGVDFEYVLQREAWGSAGALKWAAGALPSGFTETCIVLPADAVIRLDIARSLEYHQAHSAVATVITHASPVDGAVEPVWVLPDGAVRGTTPDVVFPSRTTPGYATGAYLFEPRVLDYIPARTRFDFYEDLLPALMKNGAAVSAYTTQGYCARLSNLKAYHAAQAAVVASASEVDGVRMMSRRVGAGVWVGRNAVIHPSAKLAPPVLIGNDCRVGSEVELGPNAVIGNNVVVDDSATVRDGVVLSSTYVGRLANVEHRIAHKSVLIDPATSACVQVVDRFLMAEVDVPARSALRYFADRLIALGMLIALSPLAALIYLAVWLSAGGPVITREPRVGRRSKGADPTPRAINLLGFRTRDSSGAQTGVGGMLSRLGWDRLPELWNVVRGDLALVGVKPLSMEEASRVKEEWQLKRYECPAGVTGLWYTQADTLTDLDDTLIADAYYAATRTRREDLRLVVRTLSIWWRGVWAQPRRSAADPSRSAV